MTDLPTGSRICTGFLCFLILVKNVLQLQIGGGYLLFFIAAEMKNKRFAQPFSHIRSHKSARNSLQLSCAKYPRELFMPASRV